MRSVGFNWVENTDSITLFLTNFARWLASNVKTGPLKFAYVLRLLLHRVFRKELRKTIGIQSVEHVLESYPHFFPIAMVVEDLDSRSLALQKMDRKDHSRPFCGWHKTSNTNKELRLVKYSNNFPRVIQNHCFFLKFQDGEISRGQFIVVMEQNPAYGINYLFNPMIFLGPKVSSINRPRGSERLRSWKKHIANRCQLIAKRV